MSPELIGVMGIVVVLLLLAGRMWIGTAMALVGFLGIALIRGFDLAYVSMVGQSFRQVASSTIAVVPMFVLMGNVIAQMGIGVDMYNCAYKWVGQIRGGLAAATVIACAGLAAISGNSTPALATMSKVALPEMKKYHYNEELANGCIVAAGGLAPLIPPSMPMVMYGVLASQPIGKLFIGGILPGLLLTVLYLVTIRIIVTVSPKQGPAGPRTTLKEKIISLKYIWPVILLFALVLGGIYGGVFTPNEAGAVGALGSIIIVMSMRRFTLTGFIRILKDTALMTAMILFIMAGSFIFIHFISVSKLPFMLGEAILKINASPMSIFAIVFLVYVILGMFMDVMSIIMLTIPIVVPVMSALGFDLIWLGVILVLVFEIGLLTPPVGMDVFFYSGMSGTPVNVIFKGIWPFVLTIIICVIILTAFPNIVLLLPNNM